MRNVAFIIMAYLVSMQICYAQTGNYVKTVTFLDNTKSDSISSVQYYDGLGRAYLSASNGVSGNGNYVYTLSEYDLAGREIKKWFPVTGGSSLAQPTVGDISSLSHSTYSDSHAFLATKYDGSNRKVEIFPGGDVWESNTKVDSIDYSLNTDNQVNYYTVTNSGVELSGFWPKGALVIEKNTDADNKTSITYKNMYGDVIMTDNAGARTYYVYNNRGLLIYVLTPQYQESSDLDADAYKYEYDSYDRISSKSLPGCSYTDFVYDDKDRIVITQDPLLREKGLYRFMLYDNLGRLAIQGTTSSYDTTQINNSIATKATGGTGHNYTGYYFCQPLLPVGFDIELVNYYDDYSFLEHSMFSGSQNSTELRRNDYVSGNNSNAVFSKGSMTGQAIATSDSSMLYNVFYYDQKGRVIDERHSTLDGDVYKTTTGYSFTDKPVTVTKVLHYGQTDSYAIDTYYEYNEHNDQLEQVTVSQGGRNEVVSHITYNDLGQIATESRANNSDVVSYTYDLHGWTKTIASPFFEEELFYADAINGAVPRYNGDISALSWKADGKKHVYGFTYDNRDMLTNAIYAEETDAGGISISQKYNESATYNDNGGITMLTRKGKTNSGLYDAIDMLNYEYDGNKVINIADRIRSRLSYKDAFEYSDKHRGTAAEPDFEYNSAGMLVKDLDKGISQIIYNNIGLVDSIRFSNGNKIRYVYAMTGEKLRVTHYTATPTIFPGRFDDEITDPITDRPSNVGNRVAAPTGTSSNGAVPGGSHGENEEVQEIVMPLVKSSETFYIGGDLQLNPLTGRYTYLFGGGYCEFKPEVANADSIQYFYYTKDHLGNIRNVLTKNDNGQMEELQQTHYYPFGGIIADLSTGRDVQNRTYNAKEQDFANNLFWLDYGARQYDPTAPRFTTPDPLAEKYYGWNYYTYCVNNPMNAIDPDGRTDYRINAQGYMYECTSFWEKIKSFLGFGNNSDRIFNESNGKLLVSCEEGSIKNLQTKTVTLKNGKTVKETSFEYSGNNGSEIYESIINSSEVEWAQISYKEKGSSDNIFITDHLQDEVSTFSGRLNNLEKKAEVTKLKFNHNHPVSLDDLNSNMGAFINLDPSPKDKVTAKNHPKVVFAVYNMYNRKIQYYNDKGIYYETKF